MRNSALIITAADNNRVYPVKHILESRGFQTHESRMDSVAQRVTVGGWQLFVVVCNEQSHSVPEVIERIRGSVTAPIVVVVPPITAEFAIAAFRAGASDIIDYLSLGDEIDRMIGRLGLERAVDDSDGLRLHGSSGAIARVRSMIDRAALCEANVLITGETGTGKEVTALLIHRKSARRACPLISINCAAVPDTLLESELFGHERGAFTGAHAAREGKLEAARGGTVFLDEVGDMSLVAQAKVLRAIESRQITRLGGRREVPLDIRVIAATNQDLESMVVEKRFREDLYYRLNVARIHLPSLRERREDIPALVRVVVQELIGLKRKQTIEVEPVLMEKLTGYGWPGNIRELRNVMESMLIFRSNPARIHLADLPHYLNSRLLGAVIGLDEPRTRILDALTSAEWNKSRAARVLHCSRMTLYRKMAEYGIVSKVSA